MPHIRDSCQTGSQSPCVGISGVIVYYFHMPFPDDLCSLFDGVCVLFYGMGSLLSLARRLCQIRSRLQRRRPLPCPVLLRSPAPVPGGNIGIGNALLFQDRRAIPVLRQDHRCGHAPAIQLCVQFRHTQKSPRRRIVVRSHKQYVNLFLRKRIFLPEFLHITPSQIFIQVRRNLPHIWKFPSVQFLQNLLLQSRHCGCNHIHRLSTGDQFINPVQRYSQTAPAALFLFTGHCKPLHFFSHPCRHQAGIHQLPYHSRPVNEYGFFFQFPEKILFFHLSSCLQAFSLSIRTCFRKYP